MLILLLALIFALLGIVLGVNVETVSSANIRTVMAHPTQRQAEGLILLDEEADLPGTEQLEKAVEAYARKQEQKRQRWLAAQEKRVAVQKEKRLQEERYAKALKEAKANTARTWNCTWSGAVLSKGSVTIIGPSGKETYYNLNMSRCVAVLRAMGYSEALYPYKVREDGCKTLGGYVMVAANLGIRPRGSLIMTSRGIGIVADTGGFARRNPTQLDLAVNW